MSTDLFKVTLCISYGKVKMLSKLAKHPNTDFPSSGKLESEKGFSFPAGL